MALYQCLSPILIKSKRNIESFKNIIDNDLKQIKPDNNELINYLFIKKFNFDENYINEERFKYSSQIAEASENNTIDTIKSKLKITYNTDLEIQFNKAKSCNINWPYCMNDTYFENVSQIIFYTTLGKQKLGEYKDDWFFSKKTNYEKNKINIPSENENEDDNDYDNKYNIAIERRPHFCAFAEEHIIKGKKSEEIIGNNIDINKEMEKKNEKEKENNINDIKDNKNNEQNSNTPTATSIKSDSEEINSEEDMK